MRSLGRVVTTFEGLLLSGFATEQRRKRIATFGGSFTLNWNFTVSSYLRGFSLLQKSWVLLGWATFCCLLGLGRAEYVVATYGSIQLIIKAYLS